MINRYTITIQVSVISRNDNECPAVTLTEAALPNLG